VVDAEAVPQPEARVQVAARPQARELRVERLQPVAAAALVVEEAAVAVERVAAERRHLLLRQSLSWTCASAEE
jgi:hypothetical protein